MVYGTVTPTKKRGFGSTQNLTNMSKRSKIDSSMASAVSKMRAIPAFSRFGAPTKSQPPKAPSTPSNEGFERKKLRRRSKSANNLLRPLDQVKSKVTSRFNQFRTPQPVKKAISRLPRACKTEKKPKNPAKPRREQYDCQPIIEDLEKENELGSEFEEPSAIRGPFGEQCPTSIKSAPVFNDEDAGPMSYEDFGEGIDKRYARSSAIGAFGFSKGGSYEH